MMRLIFILSTLLIFGSWPALALDCSEGKCHESEALVVELDENEIQAREKQKEERGDCALPCFGCHQLTSTLALAVASVAFEQFIILRDVSLRIDNFYHPPYLESSFRPPLLA